MHIYATAQDYRDHLDDEDADVSAATLRRASLLIARATRLSSYEHDADGAPTNPDDIAAFRAATCEQVAYWDAIGDEDGLGADDRYDSVKLGDAQYTRAKDADGQVKGADGLATGAALYLHDRHLLTPRVTVYG